jgi:beta-aspartyl-dipeptidase (metallo-type)
MMLLVQNADLHAPERIGPRDILVAAGRIVAIADRIDLAGLPAPCEVLDARGLAVVPGFVDSHVHVTGGGGEGGYRTRTPELVLSGALKAGVTTVVGVLGTDGVARSMEALVAKLYGLREEGLSAYGYTGSYRVPLTTVTGDPVRDIMMIEPILGIGELAISDHRSSKPTDAELARIASEARLGGMLSGKAGVVNVHLGDAPAGFEPLERVIAPGDLPRTQFLPTHCNRNPIVLEQSFAWTLAGGYADYTTSTVPRFLEEGETSAAEAFALCLSRKVPADRVTWSSDGQGSLPSFDAAGKLSGLLVGTCASLLSALREAVKVRGIPLETALLPITANPAAALKLTRKGRIAPGMDGDLVVLDRDFKPVSVVARGRVMIRDGRELVSGTFENIDPLEAAP